MIRGICNFKLVKNLESRFMKRICCLIILSITGLVNTNCLLSQTLIRLTTAELLCKTKLDNRGFQPGEDEESIDDALPLIDSSVAVELAKLSGVIPYNRFGYAITLQCQNESLKRMVLTHLLEYDKLCNGTLISKNTYDQQGLAGVYEYGRFTGSMISQTDTGDSNLLSIAAKEFEYWAPMAKDYIDVIMKSGMHQLAIKSGKRKFEPCVLASAENCSLWVACIYLITGEEEYGSSNEQLNDVYSKLMKKLRIDKRMDNRKEFVRLGKTDIITTTLQINALDSIDFEIIPKLKEKLDNTSKKDNAKIIVYTHGKKALLYLDYTEMVKMGFSKQLMRIPSLYLLELDSPTTIRLTKINFRERYN